MTESITTPTALVQTTNGERCYANSGLVSVDDTETTLLEIDNVGERDIMFNINPIVLITAADIMDMKVKSNGIIIYEVLYQKDRTQNWSVPFIIPANTSLTITFTNADSSSHSVGVSCYGRYLSM
jgi:hypothetical protein